MISNKYNLGTTLMGRLSYQCDLLESISEIIVKNNIKTGYVNLIGAVTSSRIGYFDVNKKEYQYLENTASSKPFEIASCSGNISIKNEKPFVHLHIVFADEKGNCHGGHLMRGTKVYACE